MVYVKCTLKKSPQSSHTQSLIEVSKAILTKKKLNIEEIQFINHQVATRVYPDMTENGWDTDEWPSLSKRIMDADVLTVGTPIWSGEKSSEGQKLIARFYAMSSQTNDKGHYIFYGKVGGCIVTDNEDGIRRFAMDLHYSLQQLGYSIPPHADGKGEPSAKLWSYLMEGKKLDAPFGFISDFTKRSTTFMTYNLLH